MECHNCNKQATHNKKIGVYLIFESKIDNYTDRVIEVYSDFEKAWQRHIELNNKSSNEYAYSITKMEVKK